MAIVEEPIISRLDRLDLILKQLEDIRGGYHSPKSSTASTESGLTSGGQAPSSDFSPKSYEANFRPLDDAVVEAEMKGTLMGRLLVVEQRVMQLCLQLEEELEAEKKKRKTQEKERKEEKTQVNKSPKGKGLKRLVKSCMGAGIKDDSGGRHTSY